ncbi:MAG: hypothetical protein IT577_03235, partial [Verrucomicrobiae bacterium]|nr:hypothetical protein [Verrucomicrobiae bacterium]
MSASRALCMMALIVSMPPPDLSAQTNTYTNDNTGNTALFWTTPANWSPNGEPGFKVSTATGDSNDIVIVNFLTSGAATQTPQLDFDGEEYVFGSLIISEDSVASHNADGNFLNTGGFGGIFSVTQTLERVVYTNGGRQIDIYPEITLRDKIDGKPFEILMGGNALDIGGGLVGTEGLIISNNQTLYIRGMESMSYGPTATNGLTFTGSSGSSKYFFF